LAVYNRFNAGFWHYSTPDALALILDHIVALGEAFLSRGVAEHLFDTAIRRLSESDRRARG